MCQFINHNDVYGSKVVHTMKEKSRPLMATRDYGKGPKNIYC